MVIPIPDTYEAVFRWPYTNASHVIVTGTFDQWAGTIALTKMESGFETTVKIPWGEKIAYKFIVDGNWTTKDDQPVESDPTGNWNNVYTAPPRPIPSVPDVTPSQLPGFTTTTSPAPAIDSTAEPVLASQNENNVSTPPTTLSPSIPVESAEPSSGSPAPSNLGTVSSRKKRRSIMSKLKGVFGHGKD